MAAVMVYPEVKHGGDASTPAVNLPIADVVAKTIDHRVAGAGPPKLVTPAAVRALNNGPPEACSDRLFDGHETFSGNGLMRPCGAFDAHDVGRKPVAIAAAEAPAMV
jgi:hypothetical protein